MLALIFGRLLSALVYQTPPADPLTFGAAALALAALALAASAVPARKAARTDPARVLRSD